MGQCSYLLIFFFFAEEAMTFLFVAELYCLRGIPDFQCQRFLVPVKLKNNFRLCACVAAFVILFLCPCFSWALHIFLLHLFINFLSGFSPQFNIKQSVLLSLLVLLSLSSYFPAQRRNAHLTNSILYAKIIGRSHGRNLGLEKQRNKFT